MRSTKCSPFDAFSPRRPATAVGQFLPFASLNSSANSCRSNVGSDSLGHGAMECVPQLSHGPRGHWQRPFVKDLASSDKAIHMQADR